MENYQNEYMKNYGHLNLAKYPGVGKYQFPEVYAVNELPDIKDWVQFNYMKTTRKKKSQTGVNFYIVDQQFERVWNFPVRYGKELSQYAAVIGPDFSTFLDFPEAVRIWNTYRNRWLTRFWQDMGLTVIPEVGWGLEDSWDWCFDSLPKHSIVAVSNVGCMTNKVDRENFKKGYDEMLRRLEPTLVLFYCHKIENYDGNIRFIRFDMNKSNSAC